MDNQRPIFLLHRTVLNGTLFITLSQPWTLIRESSCWFQPPPSNLASAPDSQIGEPSFQCRRRWASLLSRVVRRYTGTIREYVRAEALSFVPRALPPSQCRGCRVDAHGTTRTGPSVLVRPPCDETEAYLRRNDTEQPTAQEGREEEWGSGRDRGACLTGHVQPL